MPKKKTKTICLKRKLDFKPSKQIKRIKNDTDTKVSTLNQHESNWSNYLPHEILFKIFKYHSFNAQGDIRKINNLKLVCKQWCLVASDHRLLHSLDLSKFTFKSSLKRILKTKQFEYLVSLNVNRLKEFTCDNLEQILTNCNPINLKELNLANCEKISTSKKNLKFIQVICDYCPNLSSLNLTGLKRQNEMPKLFSTLNLKLKHLNLSQNWISPSLLYTLSENCTNLETIDISNCDYMSPILKSKFDLDIFMRNCPNIKRFRMLNCTIKTNYDTIQKVIESEENFIHLNEFTSGLGSTHPFKSEHLSTNFLLFMMAKVCKDASNLKLLDLRTYKSPLNSQLNLFDLIKSNVLQKLYLCNSTLSEADNFYLAQAIANKWCTSLDTFDLSWCNIKKEYLDKILKSFIQNANDAQLTSLTLVGTCVDTEIVQELVLKVPTLKNIDLSSCRSIERGMKKNNCIDELKIFFKNFSK